MTNNHPEEHVSEWVKSTDFVALWERGVWVSRAIADRLSRVLCVLFARLYLNESLHVVKKADSRVGIQLRKLKKRSIIEVLLVRPLKKARSPLEQRFLPFMRID